ncbi:MAG: DUF4292 domain-containing protein [Rhodothermales bacterium]
MPNRSLVLVVIFSVALFMMGCAGSRLPIDKRPDLPEGFPHHTLEQITQQLDAAGLDTLRAFQAKASLSVRTPEQSGTLTADMQHRRSDSLLMSLSPGLGIVAARILVTPDSFFVHDRIKKELTYGSLTYAAGFLPIPLSGDDLFRSFVGLLQLDSNNAWELDADTSYYHVRDPMGRRLYTIDPTVWRVVRYEERTGTGELLERRVYSEYDTFDTVFLPRRIILQRPLDDTHVTIYYRSLTLNPSALSFAWQVGPSVKRVLADEAQDTPHE